MSSVSSLTFEEQQIRAEAARTLGSIEELIWHANARNESVAQTRLYFEKLLVGVNPNDPAPDWIEAVYGDRAPLQPGQPISQQAMQEMSQHQNQLRVQAQAQAQALAYKQERKEANVRRGGRHSMGDETASGRKDKKARRSLPSA